MNEDLELAGVDNSKETHIEPTQSIEEMFLSLDDTTEVEVEDPQVEDNLEANTDEVDSELESEDDEVESDELGSEDEVESDVETIEEPEIDNERIVKLADGKEVSFAELRQGYLRQADYSRKTAEVADMRKQLQSQLELMVPAVDKALTEMETKIKQAGGWEGIRSKHPEIAEQLSQQYVQLKQTSEHVHKQFDSMRQARAEQEAQQLLERKRNAVKELTMAIPNLTQDTLNEMADYAVESGYTPEEVDALADSKAWIMLHKAMLHDKAKSAVKSQREMVTASKKNQANKAAPAKGNPIQSFANPLAKALKVAKTAKDPLVRQAALNDAFANLD